LVIGAVTECHLDVLHLVTREDAAPQGFPNALLYRLEVFPWDRTANDVIFKNKPGALFAGLDGNLDVAVLPVAAGLPNILSFRVSLLSNRFLVRDLRLAD